MLNRRDAIIASAALAATASTTAVAKSLNLDLSKTVDSYRAYVKMRGAGEGKLALWWYTGTVWLKVESQVPRQVMTIDGCSFQRLSMRPDGSLVQLMAEAGYFKDADGNAILETWVNPFNQEVCKVRHYKSNQTIIAKPDTSLTGEEGGRMDGDNMIGRIGPASVNGDQVWIPENFGARFAIPKRENVDPLEDFGDVLANASLASFTAKLSDIQNADLESAPSTMHFQNLGPQRPWMRFGKTNVAQTWQLFGHKVASIDAIPTPLRARLEKDYPGWLADPGI
jgi:hypothetical protein